jgi:HlyD family secretion protein
MRKRGSGGLALLIEERPIESFEQLDSVLRIVTLRGWFFLGVLFLTLGSFGVFSWFYKAPLKVDGRGIILAKDEGKGDSLVQVTAPAAGRISQVEVAIGEFVEKGEVLASIDQPELRDQIEEVKEELKRLIDENARLTQFDQDEEKKRAEALAELERTLEANRALDKKRLSTSQRIAQGDKSLNLRRMLNDIDTLKSQADADAIASGIGALEARLSELQYDRLQDQTTRKREQLKRQLGIQTVEIKRDLLEGRLKRDSRVITEYAGKVVDLMLTPHALVEKGAPAALLQPERRVAPRLEVIVFVPAGLGKRIHAGDRVEVSPDTVRRQEHGFVKGEVRSISEIPATEMAMLAELKHKTLVSSFAGQYTGQVLLSIHVELKHIPATWRPDGPERLNYLAWSSSSGEKQNVSSGTLCAASIVVDERRLIMLALPWVRHLVGYY